MINQFKATVTHSSQLQPQTCVQEHCPGETGLPSSVFQAVHEMSLVLLSKVLNYPVWGHLEGNNAVQYQERLNLMHAKFHCCGTTTS